ncbi:MAG: hypothetical protein MI920_14550, partial [Kiloniellales bacterium]|nr:hypothetical protein [Kiloniellales bacterium]
ALAIAGSSAPNLTAVAYSRVMGNHVKEGLTWATATGLAAVDLAATGFTGPLDLYDHEDHYDPAKLSHGLGESWLIDSVYFKPYSCCRWAHAAIDALIELQMEGAIPASEIEAIEVHTFGRALRLNNDLAPANLEAAQYSLPFCIALVALRGTGALLPLREGSLADREVLALAERVHLQVDPQLDAMFSEAVPARLEVVMPQGRVTRTVITPKGEAANPMTRADLRAKFDIATASLVEGDLVSSLLDAVEAFENGDIQPLFAALATPLGDQGLQEIPDLAVRKARS